MHVGILTHLASHIPEQPNEYLCKLFIARNNTYVTDGRGLRVSLLCFKWLAKKDVVTVCLQCCHMVHMAAENSCASGFRLSLKKTRTHVTP